MAIARVHLLKKAGAPCRRSVVIRTMKTIEQRSKTRGSRANLFQDADFTKVASDTAGKEGGKEKPVGKEKKTARRKVSLRARPPLVSRRPARSSKS